MAVDGEKFDLGVNRSAGVKKPATRSTTAKLKENLAFAASDDLAVKIGEQSRGVGSSKGAAGDADMAAPASSSKKRSFEESFGNSSDQARPATRQRLDSRPTGTEETGVGQGDISAGSVSKKRSFEESFGNSTDQARPATRQRVDSRPTGNEETGSGQSAVSAGSPSKKRSFEESFGDSAATPSDQASPLKKRLALALADDLAMLAREPSGHTGVSKGAVTAADATSSLSKKRSFEESFGDSSSASSDPGRPDKRLKENSHATGTGEARAERGAGATVAMDIDNRTITTRRTQSLEILDKASERYSRYLSDDPHVPLGKSPAAKFARDAVMGIASKNYDKMIDGTPAERAAIVKSLNQHTQKITYESSGKSPRAFDVQSARDLGFAARRMEEAKAKSLVPNEAGANQIGPLPPHVQQRVAEHLSGKGGFEVATNMRNQDYSSWPTGNSSNVKRPDGAVEKSSLNAALDRSQKAIQKELAPHTAPGAEGKIAIAAAVKEINNNRVAIVRDRGHGDKQLYSGVNQKMAEAVKVHHDGRASASPAERNDRIRTRGARGD